MAGIPLVLLENDIETNYVEKVPQHSVLIVRACNLFLPGRSENLIVPLASICQNQVLV